MPAAAPASETPAEETRPASQLTRLSPSALERYRTCPKRFFFSDVERRPVEQRPSPVLAQANAIHHALERWHGLPREQRTPETIERALRSVWHEHRTSVTFGSRDAEAAAGRAAILMLRRYADSGEADAVVRAREHWVGCRFRGSGVELHGKVDRIGELASGGLEIVDYKTGRRELEPEDLRDDPAAQVYLVCTEAALQRPVERIRFIYLASGRSVSWEPEREDVQATLAKLVRLVDEIREAEDFEANPGPGCSYCPFALDCEARQRVELDSLVPVEDLPF